MIKILAAPVSAPDISTRYGQSLFIPKFPFMLGYAVIGDVEAVGEGVTGVAIGDRLAALTAYGGYAEHLYCRPLIGSLGRAGQTAVHTPRSS